MLRDPLTKSRLWPVVLAAIVLTACAGRLPLGAGMQGAAAQLGGPAAQPRAWSEAMEQRRARLSDVLSSAGVEVQRTPDNVLLVRWPADRAAGGALLAGAVAKIYSESENRAWIGFAVSTAGIVISEAHQMSKGAKHSSSMLDIASHAAGAAHCAKRRIERGGIRGGELHRDAPQRSLARLDPEKLASVEVGEIQV